MGTSLIDVCNLALDLMGGNRHIQTLDDRTPEAEACKRLYKPVLDSVLNTYNWSFCRRDEILNADDIVSDALPLPFNLAYRVPDDVMQILMLTEVDATPDIESLRRRNRLIRYNLRNIEEQIVIATNHPPDIAIHYQCYTEEVSLGSPMFREALAYLLADKLACALIKGTSGLSIADKLYQKGMMTLGNAASRDATQGVETVTEGVVSSFIKARM